MKILKTAAAAAFAFIFFPSAAYAQDYEQTLDKEELKFQQWDMNLNGALELSEFASFGFNRGWNQAQVENSFLNSDVNGDGRVTFTEFWENGGGSA